MDSELREVERSGDALKHAVQLRRAGRLEECADSLEKAWLGGDSSCGDALFQFLDEWRPDNAVAVATRLDRLACAGNDRARAVWESWFPALTRIVGVSDNMQGLRRTVLEHASRPFDSILNLIGPDGVGKSTAARALNALTKGSRFRECDYFTADLPQDEWPPENGTFYVDRCADGSEARCVDQCRARHARLVICQYPGNPRWRSLQALDLVDYVVTPLAERPEDIPALIRNRFPEWLLPDDPDFQGVETIHVQPEAVAALSREPWGGMNARWLFFTLMHAAYSALRSTGERETLTIRLRDLPERLRQSDGA